MNVMEMKHFENIEKIAGINSKTTELAQNC